MIEVIYATDQLKELIKSIVPDGQFNVQVDYSYDTEKCREWVIKRRIDAKKEWNDFIAHGDDLETTLQLALKNAKESSEELLAETA